VNSHEPGALPGASDQDARDAASTAPRLIAPSCPVALNMRSYYAEIPTLDQLPFATKSLVISTAPLTFTDMDASSQAGP
jgi:hypothetical protein